MKFNRIAILILIAVFSFTIGFELNNITKLFTNTPKVVQESPKQDPDKLHYELLNGVWRLIQEKYVNPKVFSEKEPFEYGMIKGLVAGLDDPFSSFMTPQENQDFRESLQGNFQGIGAELAVRSSAITVVTPLKGSPAQTAGIMPEDIVLKVDGNDITGEALTDVVRKIRGPKGSKVSLTIFRPSNSETLDISVMRDTISIPSVESKMIDTIAYIELNQFGDDTRKLFEEQFMGLMKNNPQGIILDLRFNGGGYLDGAIDIASAFFPSNTKVVEVKTRSDDSNHTTEFKPFTNTQIPLIVLVNKGSASASEIVAGAIQDHKRGLILGEQSYGKGTVQEVIPLKDGSSLRITIAEWLTPDRKTIKGKGITPDIKITRIKEDITANKDPQLDKALEILKAGNWKEFLEKKKETPSGSQA